MGDERSTTWVQCRKCLRRTRHRIIASKPTPTYGEDAAGWPEYGETTTYEMLQCCGCDVVVMRTVRSGGFHAEDEIEYYPPAITRPTPPWMLQRSFRELHGDVACLLREVYTALGAGSNRLAMMGARAILDRVIRDCVGDCGTFGEKLCAMEKQRYISKESRQCLEAAIEAGNAAAHRDYRPNDDDLARVMDVVENLIQAAYVLPDSTADLRKRTPPRRTGPE